MNNEQVIKYAKTRLFGKNVRCNWIKEIHQFDAYLDSMLINHMKENNLDFKKVEQENGRENIYFVKDKNALFFAQSSGFGRSRRYESMINAYIAASKKDIKYEIHYPDNDPLNTINFSNFAFDLSTGLFVPKEKYEANRVFENDDIKDITKIVFGSTDAVAKQAEVVARGNSEYIDAQIVKLGGRRILNIGYVYSDQARFILNNLLHAYNSYAISNKKKLNIDVLMFGKVGGLEDSLERHDLVYPTCIINSGDKDWHQSHFDNALIDKDGVDGINLNVKTVIGQDIKTLEYAKLAGCVCVEMECKESLDAINNTREWYDHNLDIKFGFVGYVSDRPLKGDTLADELEGDEGEQAAVKKALDYER